MKKKRTISIKNPRLRRIRGELRSLLQLAESKQIHDLIDKIEKIQNSEVFWDENHPDFKRLHKEVQQLNSQENDLSYAFNSSIAWCPVCRSADKDMTYNPVSKQWLCTECYISNQRFQTSQGHPELYP
jgi:hypothetical protein